MSLKNIKKLTLLHSNDLHGDFFTENLDSKLIGGVSMLSGYVNKVRNEEANTLYLIAGDMFRGSIIDSEFKGISTIDIMNLLGPDVVSLGNHEFDYGISHLVFLDKCAKFDIVNANIYIKTTHTRLFNSHKILKIGGMNIMVIGIVTEDIMHNAKTDNLIGTFVDLSEAADEIAKICNNYKTDDIDFTIILSHIGFEEDRKLANLLDPELGVDVIIGGHSHTVLDKPCEENGILIAQAGVGTNQIGRFDILIDTDTNSVASYSWELIPITEERCPRDLAIEAAIGRYKDETDRKYNRILTRLNKMLTHPVRNKETEVGNLFSDILLDSLETDIVLLGSGSLRVENFGPVVTYGDLCEMYPYVGKVHRVMLTGKQLYTMYNWILREEAFDADCHTEFYQFSRGLQVTYSKSKKCVTKITLNNKKIEDDKLYSVAIQNFHYENMDKFLNLDINEVKKNKTPKVIATSELDIFEERLTLSNNLDANVEKRLNIIK